MAGIKKVKKASMEKVGLYFLVSGLFLSGCDSAMRPFLMFKYDETTMLKKSLRGEQDKTISSVSFDNDSKFKKQDLNVGRDKTFYSTKFMDDEDTKLEITSKHLRIRKTF